MFVAWDFPIGQKKKKKIKKVKAPLLHCHLILTKTVVKKGRKIGTNWDTQSSEIIAIGESANKPNTGLETQNREKKNEVWKAHAGRNDR
jgi:hypothetical protein